MSKSRAVFGADCLKDKVMDVGEENEETEALVSVVFGLTVRARFRQRGPRAPWRVCACVSVRAQFRVRPSARVPFPKPPLCITSSESLSRPRQLGWACSGVPSEDCRKSRGSGSAKRCHGNETSSKPRWHLPSQGPGKEVLLLSLLPPFHR